MIPVDTHAIDTHPTLSCFNTTFRTSSQKHIQLHTLATHTILLTHPRYESTSSITSSSSTATEQIHAVARRLFKKAVTINKYHSASWVAWAKHEQRAGINPPSLQQRRQPINTPFRYNLIIRLTYLIFALPINPINMPYQHAL